MVDLSFVSDEFCKGRGEELHTYPGDPTRYIMCGGGRGWVKECPPNSEFSEATKSCSIYSGPTVEPPKSTQSPGGNNDQGKE